MNSSIVKIRLGEPFKDQCIESSRGKVLNKSMRGSEANLVGAYGEQIVLKYFKMFGIPFSFDDKTTHDIKTPCGTVEVKTKERTVIPKTNYDCTVPAYNHEHQQADWFVFVSLLNNGLEGNRRFDRAFILGVANLETLKTRAKLWNVGMVDDSNGWKPKIDCYNIKIYDLDPIDCLVDLNKNYKKAVYG